MENNARYVETCGAGERAGLYYTCVNSFLTSEELAYILTNSESKILITSQAKRDVALAAVRQCLNITRCLIVDGPGDGDEVLNFDEAVASFPDVPIADEELGGAMIIPLAPLAGRKASCGRSRISRQIRPCRFSTPWSKAWRFREGLIYLSPAPLYHAAPHVGVNLTVRLGGTAIIMERFDPESFLGLIEKYNVSHTQLVPTMFSRMLELPGRNARPI